MSFAGMKSRGKLQSRQNYHMPLSTTLNQSDKPGKQHNTTPPFSVRDGSSSLSAMGRGEELYLSLNECIMSLLRGAF